MARDVSSMDDLIRDMRQGGRLLRRDPGFSAIVLTALAVAIGAKVLRTD
jgi:hypothetical protein